MIVAARLANTSFTNPDKSVPVTAMPAPTPALVINSIGTLGENAQATVDKLKSASAPTIILSRPNWCASQGVGNASRPISRSGMVVRRDATQCNNANSSRTAVRVGPIDTSDGRSVSATTTMPNSAIALPH